jgi:hypothetical protein
MFRSIAKVSVRVRPRAKGRDSNRFWVSVSVTFIFTVSPRAGFRVRVRSIVRARARVMGRFC